MFCEKHNESGESNMSCQWKGNTHLVEIYHNFDYLISFDLFPVKSV